MLPIFASGITAHVASTPPSWMNTNNLHLPYSSATHPAPNSNSQIPQWWQNAFPSFSTSSKELNQIYCLQTLSCRRWYPKLQPQLLKYAMYFWFQRYTLSIFPDGMNLSMRYYVLQAHLNRHAPCYSPVQTKNNCSPLKFYFITIPVCFLDSNIFPTIKYYKPLLINSQKSLYKGNHWTK